jgi:hypothetical protein
MQRSTHVALMLAAFAVVAGRPAVAGSPIDIQRTLEAEARRAAPAFAGFSAERGARFFNERHGGDWSCASCHTADPRGPGRHAATGKAIAPLAPAANPERFTTASTVEKWFRRNCNDVLGRACTPLEKGDVLTWLLSLGGR